MASVIAGAAVRANDALQKMLESKRKAVLEQQRANEVRQQQQDLKAYRSQTIQEGQARIQQQREAAENLAEYRKASLDQTALLAADARDHEEKLAKLERDQREKIAALERADENYDALLEDSSLRERTRAQQITAFITSMIRERGAGPTTQELKEFNTALDRAEGKVPVLTSEEQAQASEAQAQARVPFLPSADEDEEFEIINLPTVSRPSNFQTPGGVSIPRSIPGSPTIPIPGDDANLGLSPAPGGGFRSPGEIALIRSGLEGELADLEAGRGLAHLKTTFGGLPGIEAGERRRTEKIAEIKRQLADLGPTPLNRLTRFQ